MERIENLREKFQDASIEIEIKTAELHQMIHTDGNLV